MVTTFGIFVWSDYHIKFLIKAMTLMAAGLYEVDPSITPYITQPTRVFFVAQVSLILITM